MKKKTASIVWAFGIFLCAAAVETAGGTSVPETPAEFRGRPVRVGMINADLHAMYYAALFEAYNPLVLRDDPIGRGHAAYHYFFTHYNDPLKMTVRKAAGLRLVKIWDRNPALAENMSRIFDSHPQVCGSVEEVSDGVDVVFIADCNGEGKDHRELASPGLKKRVPTFIDKPLAYDLEDAEKIILLAGKGGTPLMSSSILEELPHVDRFRNRFAEIGYPEFGIIKGGGPTMAGQIHAILLALTLFGKGVESVECMGDSPLGIVRLSYGTRPDRPKSGVVLACDSGGTYEATYNVSAYSSRGAIHADDFGDYAFPLGAVRILENIREMASGGHAEESLFDRMREGVAVATAARLAQTEKRRVFLSEIAGPR